MGRGQPRGRPRRVAGRSTTWCATRCRRSAGSTPCCTSQEAAGTDGRIDLAPLVDAAPDIVAAAASAHARAGRRRRDRHGCSGRRGWPDPSSSSQDGLDQVTGALDAGAQVARSCRRCSGADGPRTYLLVSLNSAELRSAGGIVGAFAVLHAEDGNVDLTEQRTTLDLPGIESSILPAHATRSCRIDTDRLGRWVQNAVMTPDFPRSAELLEARWERDIGQHVDGVIATDPVAVLATSWRRPARSPSPAACRSTRRTCCRCCCATPTCTYGDDADSVDTFYTGVAATIFQAVGSGQGDSRAVWSRAGAGGRRGAAPDVVGAPGGAGAAGGHERRRRVPLRDVPRRDGRVPQRRDRRQARLLPEHGGDGRGPACTGPDPMATVRLDLSYAPPADVAELPALRHRAGAATGLPVGWLATNVTVYSPVGADARRDRSGRRLRRRQDRATASGRDVKVVTSWLAPGDARDLPGRRPGARRARDACGPRRRSPSPGLVTADLPVGPAAGRNGPNRGSKSPVMPMW